MKYSCRPFATGLIFSLTLFTLFAGCNKVDEITGIETANPVNGVNAVFNYKGYRYDFMIYKPADLPADAPLIFVLHGSGQDNLTYYNWGFNGIADTAKFLLCYPLGKNHVWELQQRRTTDVLMLKSLAQALQEKYNLSTTRTFSCGFSAGACMSYLLAMDAGDVFKAIACLSGTIGREAWDARPSSTRVPCFTIHGTADDIVPIAGGGYDNAPPTQEIVDYFANSNKCILSETKSVSPNTTGYLYINQAHTKEVRYYRIDGLGHWWPSDSNVAGFNPCTEIWSFFRLSILN